MLERFLRNIYGGAFDTSTEVEPAAWREVLRILGEATAKGLAQGYGPNPPSHQQRFLERLRHGNEVFAAFKVHTMGRKMAERLRNPDGSLKPYAQWVREVAPIASHHTGAWLRTEYDTAVIRAHNAAEWQRFVEDADVMPNLRWMPTTSGTPDREHAVYWREKLTLPVSHPFWEEHHPGDRWNCKCSLEQTDDPPTGAPAEQDAPKAQPGLENNPGKDGRLFSQTHPYFPTSCAKCPLNKGVRAKLRGMFSNQKKDCYNCRLAGKMIWRENANSIREKQDVPPPAAETYSVSPSGGVFTSPYHGDNERLANERLAEFLHKKLGKKVYLLPRLDPKNEEESVLRSILHPTGVKERKNPDFYIGGLLFDGKSMLKVKDTSSKKKHHNDILNRIKSAKEQADNVVLEIPTFITRKTISKAINGYLRQSHTKRFIIVKHGRKCYVYT